MAESKVEKILKEIEEMKVLELNELVKAIEDKFGVSAAPAMMAAAPAAGTAAPAEEKTTFDVVITDAGANKLQVIKAVREIDQALGLIDAKKLVEAAPKEVLKAAKKDAAEEAKKKLEAAGAKVELK